MFDLSGNVLAAFFAWWQWILVLCIIVILAAMTMAAAHYIQRKAVEKRTKAQIHAVLTCIQQFAVPLAHYVVLNMVVLTKQHWKHKSVTPQLMKQKQISKRE